MTRKMTMALATLCIAAGTFAAAVWEGGGSNAKWSNAANWKNSAKPQNGEGVTIAGSYSGDIELDEDYSISGQQFLFNQYDGDGRKSVRLTGDHTLTLNYPGAALYLYPGRELIIDGARIENINNSGGFNINAGSHVEMRSGAYIETGSSGSGYVQGDLTITGGEFRPRRLARNAGTLLLLSGGYLDFQTDNGAQTGTNGFVFTGGTLSTPNVVYGPSFLPVATNQTLVAKNTSSTSIDAMNTSAVFRVAGTIVMTNNYAAGTRQRISLAHNPVTVGGRGTIYANSIYLSGTAGEYAHFDVRKLRSPKLERGTWGVCLATHNGLDLGTYGADLTLDGGIDWYYSGLLDIDTTDAFDETVGRTISMSAMYPGMVPGLRVTGMGTLSFSLSNDTAPKGLFSLLELGAGTSAMFSPAANNSWLCYDVVKLGANAVLSLNSHMMRVHSVARAAEIDHTAVINFTELGDKNGNLTVGARYTILNAGPWGDLGDVTINAVTLPTGWRLLKTGPVAYLADGNDVTIPQATSGTQWYWTSAGGNWSDAANWNTNKYNTAQTSYPPSGSGHDIRFAVTEGSVVTNDTGGAVSVERMHFLKGSGPVILRGSPFVFTASAIYSSASAIVIHGGNYSDVIFETPVSSEKSSVFAQATVGYLSFLRGFNVTNGCFVCAGETTLGGESTMAEILPYGIANSDGSAGRQTILTLATGAVVTVTAQATSFSYPSKFRIAEDAQFKFTGGELVSSTGQTFAVHGLVDIGVPFSAHRTQKFYGEGRVNIASTKSHAMGSGVVEIGEGMHLYPGFWSTVSSEAPDSTMTISVGSAATIGATNDWTYGPAAGVATSTTAAERALVTEGLYAPLTINTTDPDTGAGHTITFADPILAAGDVFVKGVGAVCFASRADSFGQILSFDDQVTLALGAAQRQAALAGWTPVLTAAKIVGVPRMADGVRVRLADNGDGTQSLMCRVVGGTTIVIR